MRRRSCTLYAETVEEYTALAIQTAPNKDNSPQSNPFKAANRPKRLSVDRLTPSIKIQEITEEQSSSSMWADFDYKPASKQQEIQESMLLDSPSGRRMSDIETDCTDSLREALTPKLRELMIKRFMVLSSADINSHELIHSTFNNNNNELIMAPIKQTMDLIIKNDEEDRIQCHFWLKTLEDQRYESLMRVYYKAANSFIFVYSASNKNSFELVEQAIQNILNEVPRESFVGLLIGYKPHSEEAREVSEMDGAFLQQKYSLAYFNEVSTGNKTLKDKILNPVDSVF